MRKEIEFCNNCQMWFKVKRYGCEVGILGMVEWDGENQGWYYSDIPPNVDRNKIRVFEDIIGKYHRCGENMECCTIKSIKQKLLKKLTLQEMENSSAFVSKKKDKIGALEDLSKADSHSEDIIKGELKEI